MSTYFFDGLANGELMTLKTDPPCIMHQLATHDIDIKFIGSIKLTPPQNTG